MTYYDLNMNSKRITDTQDPASAQDVATKIYVDKLFTLNTPYYFPTQSRAGRVNGIIASNYDAAQTGRFIDYNQFFTDGAPLFYSVYLKEGTVVTRGLFFNVTNTPDPALGYFGIYNKNGVRVAVSNQLNYPTGFTTNTMNELVLTSTYTVPTTDFYYLAILLNCVSYPSVPQAAASPTSGSGIANLLNFPQTSNEVNTGNLSVFRSAVTTISTGGVLPANLNTFTLTGLSNQYWLAIS